MASSSTTRNTNTVVKQPESIFSKGGKNVGAKARTNSSNRGCPPGLESLIPVRKLQVDQDFDSPKVIPGADFKPQGSFTINGDTQNIFRAHEETSCCQKCCIRKDRRFNVHVMNDENVEVLSIFHPFKACTCCTICACGGCATELCIKSSTGETLGYVIQQCAFPRPYYMATDTNRNPLFYIGIPKLCCRIRNPFKNCKDNCKRNCACKCDCACDSKIFCRRLTQTPIVSLDNKRKGFIRTTFYTCIKEPTSIESKFPLGFSPTKKALVLAFMFMKSIKVTSDACGRAMSIIGAVNEVNDGLGEMGEDFEMDFDDLGGDDNDGYDDEDDDDDDDEIEDEEEGGEEDGVEDTEDMLDMDDICFD